MISAIFDFAAVLCKVMARSLQVYAVCAVHWSGGLCTSIFMVSGKLYQLPDLEGNRKTQQIKDTALLLDPKSSLVNT